MSETTNTPETDFQTPTEDPTPTPEPTKEPEISAEHSPESETHDDAEAEEAASTSSEAAKYRKRAQDAEAEIATLTTHLDTLYKAQVDRSIGNTPGKGNADLLWASGITPEELLTDGVIDNTKVHTALTGVLTALGLTTEKPTIIPARITRTHPSGGTAPTHEAAPASWSAALK